MEDARLVVSELVGNAVQHGDSDMVRLEITHPEPKQVCVSVSDESVTAPQPRRTATLEETGRGLLLVEVLAVDWGTQYAAGGKTVWAVLRATA